MQGRSHAAAVRHKRPQGLTGSGEHGYRVRMNADPEEAAEGLSEAIRRLEAAKSREAVIDVVRRAAREVTGAFGVAVVVREGDLCHYIAEDCAVPLWAGQRFPLDACISGWSMLNGQQAVIPNIYLDDRIPHQAYRPTGIHSLVMTPVGGPEPFAALGAYWCNIREPTESEIGSLTALAQSMAKALRSVDA